MRKLYENFHIFHFQKRILSAETIRGFTVVAATSIWGNTVYALGNVNKKTAEDTKKLCFTHNMNTEKLVGCSYCK